jgi:hypothetical protein
MLLTWRWNTHPWRKWYPPITVLQDWYPVPTYSMVLRTTISYRYVRKRELTIRFHFITLMTMVIDWVIPNLDYYPTTALEPIGIYSSQKMKSHLAVVVSLALFASLATAWTSNPANVNRHSPRPASALWVSTADESATKDSSTFKPVFDFSEAAAVDNFERLDDVIMGGISTSQLMDVSGEPYAKWSGVCRTDGGYAFCKLKWIDLIVRTSQSH